MTKQAKREHKAAYMREWRKTHFLTGVALTRANVRAYANVYCQRGKIPRKPCLVCGSKNVEKHHPDYSKPLEVIWMCRKHHLELHRNQLKKVSQETITA